MRRGELVSVRRLLVVVGVVTLAVRLVPLAAAGALGSALGYDDGVHLAVAAHLVGGELPYRDVLFVHPPGIVLFLAPVAALAHLVGDPTALAVGRMLAMAVGVANAVLVGWLLRRHGAVAVLTGGLTYALWAPAIAAERSIYLEPFIGLGLLVALAAVARRQEGVPAVPDGPQPGTAPRAGPRSGATPTSSRRALAVAGLALGLACVFKVWAVFDVAVVGLLVLSRHGVRGALRWAAWGVGGAAVVLVPFVVAAPVQIWDDVVLAQARRPRAENPTHRHLVELARWSGSHGPVLRALALLVAAAVLVAVFLVLVRAVRRTPRPSAWPDPAWWAVVAVVHGAALAVAPSFYLHYSAFLAPPCCLLAGAVAGAVVRRAEQLARAWGGGFRLASRGLLGAAAVALLVLGGATFPRLPGGLPQDEALLASLTRTGCTWSPNPSYLLAAGAQTRMVDEDCPGQPDLFGIRMVAGSGLSVPGSAPVGATTDPLVLRQLAQTRTVLLSASSPNQWLGPEVRRYLHRHFVHVATTGGIEIWQRPA